MKVFSFFFHLAKPKIQIQSLQNRYHTIVSYMKHVVGFLRIHGFCQIDQIKNIKWQFKNHSWNYSTKYKHIVFLIHCISCDCTVLVSFPHPVPSTSNVNGAWYQPISSWQSEVFSTAQSADSLLLSFSHLFSRLGFSLSSAIGKTDSDRSSQGYRSPSGFREVKRSNCPCDQSASIESNLAQTSWGRPWSL